MDETTIIILIVGMFVCLALIGGGYYYTTTLQEDVVEDVVKECTGTDANAKYDFDDDGICVSMGCKDGYKEENGFCIKDITYTALEGGDKEPKNCEIAKYNEGPCVSENGRQLTGEPGRCGTGVKRFTADPDAFTMANSLGECDNFSYTEACEVPCKSVSCGANDENYTKTDGVCRGFDGNPIGGDTGRCGTGYQIYEVDPATAGKFESDELRDAWVAENWKDCTPLKKTCNVICEPGMEPSGCPELTTDIGTAYVQDRNGEKACLPKDIAVALLKGETRYDKYNMPMEKLTRGRAEQLGITSMDQLPDGYSILYKSDVVDFTDFTAKGCTTAKLEPCVQPTVSDDCVLRADVTKACYDVGCGQQQEKEVEYVIDKPAWGDGVCDQAKLGKKIQQCTEEKSPECCSVGENSHWAEPIDGYTCSADGTYNLVNTNACSTSGMENPPTRTKKCCYIGEWDTVCSDDNSGKKTYTRIVKNPELCGNKDTSTTKTDYSCPVDCQYSDWGEWLECGPNNQRARFRTIYRQGSGGGQRCGIEEGEIRTSEIEPCTYVSPSPSSPPPPPRGCVKGPNYERNKKDCNTTCTNLPERSCKAQLRCCTWNP